jgi:hypothetical protein
MLNYIGTVGKIDLGENNEGKPWEFEGKNGKSGTLEFFNRETFKIEIVKINFDIKQDLNLLKIGSLVNIPISRVYNKNKNSIDLKQVREIKIKN